MFSSLRYVFFSTSMFPAGYIMYNRTVKRDTSASEGLNCHFDEV